MAVAIQRLRWRWRVLIVAAMIVALVAVLATRGNAAQDTQYRTAIVDTGDVTQTLTASGSIDSASRYDLTFQADGTVGAVDVAVGDTVEAGQQLATLDDSDLQDAVSAAEDALTEAQSTLSDDLDAQSGGSSSSSSSSGGGSSPSGGSTNTGGSMGGSSGGTTGGATGGGTGGTTGGNSGTSDEVKAAEQAVKDAQEALLAQYDATTQALAVASQKQADAQSICADFTAMDPTDDGAADALAACQDATNDALAAQQDAAAEQSTLMDMATALNDAVTALINAIDGAANAAPAAYVTSTGQSTVMTVAAYTSGSVVTADDFAGGGSASGSQQTGSVPSAEDILADEADVTAANAELAVAQAQLEYATLATPVSGTVVAVGVAAGDAVTAGDTSTAITVIADNTYLVNLSVSLTQARMLEVGQPAKLTLLSDNQVVDGTVSSVSTVNSGNSFSQSYAVTIAVPDPGFAIRIGTATRMAITVADARDVLVAPTSAVSDATGDPTVQVIGDDGTAQTVSVKTGAVGAEYTEITDGLEKGQQVVLADLAFKLSTGDDTSSSTGGLLSGLDSSSTDQQQGPGSDFQPPDGFPGGGQGGGGFGGPPSG